MRKSTIIFGPPGTGKTFRLLEILEEKLHDKVEPRDICFITFTRRGTAEAKTRAWKKFGFVPEDMNLWRTIHSLAFRQMHLRTSMMIQLSDYEEFGELAKIHIKGTDPYEEAFIPGIPQGNRILFIENLSRLKEEPLKKTYEDFDDAEITWSEVEDVAKQYANFKKYRGIMDFTDVLERFSSAYYINRFPEVESLIIDEAQDLSSLQWTIINKLSNRVGEIYVAGDDDQAIYEWAGADVSQFQNFPGDCEVLSQSYRLPRKLVELGNSIVRPIAERHHKEFKARPVEGSINWIIDEEEVDLSLGTWLLLARNDYHLRRYKQLCEAWEITPGRRVRISTIHGAKGAEADNVLLTSDMSRRCYEQMAGGGRGEDAERRVWYVGVTRTRNEINILRPRTRYYFDEVI
jgi:DNA helicase-2/ATP-dependent DNA helicase PcrA